MAQSSDARWLQSDDHMHPKFCGYRLQDATVCQGWGAWVFKGLRFVVHVLE